MNLLLLRCKTRGGNRKANDEFSRDYVFIRGVALGRRKNLARRRLIGSVRAREKAASVGLIIGRFPFFLSLSLSHSLSFPGSFSWEIFPTRVDYSSRTDGPHGEGLQHGPGGCAVCARDVRKAKDIINLFSVVKALLKIMERISRSTNFFLYTPRIYIYRTPISSKICSFFFIFYFSAILRI